MIIYQAYNPTTCTFYVGKTTKPIWVRRARHLKDAMRRNNKSWFHKAIRKHGVDCFDWCVLAYAECAKDLDALERHWISLVKNTGHRMYNLRPGGDGGSLPGSENHNYGKKVDAETRAKISASLREYYKDRPGPMAGRSGAESPSYGYKHSEEARIKISQSNKGRIRSDLLGQRNPSARRIFCETTGETFNTMSEAAEKYAADLSSIAKCCKGKVKSVKGKVYRYANS